MRIQPGEMTIGDVGIRITIATNDASLAGKTLILILTSPTGETKEFTGTVSGQSVFYTTASADDIDEDGDWSIDLHNETTNFFYVPQARLTVRRKPGDMTYE